MTDFSSASNFSQIKFKIKILDMKLNYGELNWKNSIKLLSTISSSTVLFQLWISQKKNISQWEVHKKCVYSQQSYCCITQTATITICFSKLCCCCCCAISDPSNQKIPIKRMAVAPIVCVTCQQMWLSKHFGHFNLNGSIMFCVIERIFLIKFFLTVKCWRINNLI